MELDILNKENLDNGIMNNEYSEINAINVPIKRGMYVCPKIVMSPYYEYEYSDYSGSTLFNRANLSPKTSIGSTATVIPTSAPNISAGATLGSNNSLSTPNASVGTTSGGAILEGSTLSVPVGSSNTSTPTLSTPFTPTNPSHGGTTNVLSQSYTPTPLVTNTSNTPTNTPIDNISPMGLMPMGGGGGGGLASPVSEESNTVQASDVNNMRVANVTKKGLSKEVKIGLLLLVAIGGYYAYKNGLFSKI